MTSSLTRNNAEIFPVTKSFSKINKVLDVPDLIDVQKESFDWFTKKG